MSSYRQLVLAHVTFYLVILQRMHRQLSHQIFPTPCMLLCGTNRSPQTETMSLLLCGTHRSSPTGTNTIYTPLYVVVLTGLPELALYSLRFMVPLGRSYPFFAWVSYIHTHSAFVKHEHYTTLWTSVAIYLHTLHYMYTANKPT